MNELVNLSNELVHKIRMYEDYRPGTVLIGANDALMDGYYLLLDNYNIYRDPMHSVNYNNALTYYSLTRTTGFEFAFNSKNNVIMIKSTNMIYDAAWFNLTANPNTSYHFDVTRFKSYFMSNLKSIFGVFDHSVNNFDIANNKMYTSGNYPTMQIWSDASHVGFYSLYDEVYHVANLDTYQRTLQLYTSVSGYKGYIYENIDVEPIFKKLYIKHVLDVTGNTLFFIIKNIDRIIGTTTEIYSTSILVDTDEELHYNISVSNISNIINIGPNRYMCIPKYVEDNIGLKIGYTMFMIDDMNIVKVSDHFHEKYDIYFADNSMSYRGAELISRIKSYIKVNYDVDSDTYTIVMINQNNFSVEMALYKSFVLGANSTTPVTSNITYNTQRFNNTNAISMIHLASNDARYIVIKYDGYIYGGVWNATIAEYIFSNVAYGTDYVADFNNKKFILTDRDRIYIEQMYSSEYEIYINFEDPYYKYIGSDINTTISVACVAPDKLISKELMLTISGDCIFASNGAQSLQVSTNVDGYSVIDITITGPSVVNIYSEIM